MIIYPAIDIRAGRCVRLYQGDFAQETVYSHAPVDMAKQFLKAGASWLHLVDLDGAKNPQSNQSALIKHLLQSVPIQVQVGGGIRCDEQIDAYLASGAARVIVGSSIIESPNLVEYWLKKYGPEKIVFALDVFFEDNRFLLATQAWQKCNALELFETIERFLPQGLTHVLCTDIHKDGVGKGPNVGLYQQIISRFPEIKLQASGGIGCLGDLRDLQSLGVAGAITGRALYEQKIHLVEAISCLQ